MLQTKFSDDLIMKEGYTLTIYWFYLNLLLMSRPYLHTNDDWSVFTDGFELNASRWHVILNDEQSFSKSLVLCS